MNDRHDTRGLRRLRDRGALLAALVFTVALAAGWQSVARGNEVESLNYETLYAPSRDLGSLFHEIQVSKVFPDSKTLVDARPLRPPAEILSRYADTQLDLATFVERHFAPPQPPGIAKAPSMEAHIQALWPVLTRAPDQPISSLIPLPNAYIVPGGRFREIYYWDSYFTMLGLIQSGRTDLVRSMLDNFAYLVRAIGHIPNGNRTYYLSRSQPPFFGAMVSLYAEATGQEQAWRYLDALEMEHAFWMDGADSLAPGQAHRRVVRLADGSLLNRHWDDRPEPRPESYLEDYRLAQTLAEERRAAFYRNVRATAESGWDFSSRWMRDPSDLLTLETTELIPIDLNSLLYHAERTIAALRLHRGQPGDSAIATRFTQAAEQRVQALRKAAYDPAGGFFYDVRWRTGERVTDRPSMAAAVPLFFGLATPEQGAAVAERLERDFLSPGGFVTTRIASGQQWDAPNGWAPLQWMAVVGLCRYDRAPLAAKARERWLDGNRQGFQSTGKMVEKYDVTASDRLATGGEYPTQDGFGWTNGVALAFLAQEKAAASGTTADAALACAVGAR